MKVRVKVRVRVVTWFAIHALAEFRVFLDVDFEFA